MSKELEALRMLEQVCLVANVANMSEQINLIETALKDYEKRLILAKEYQDINNVAKRLKALEIIKDKKVNVGLLSRCVTGERYNKGICYEPRHLTQEEYDLLREILL